MTRPGYPGPPVSAAGLPAVPAGPAPGSPPRCRRLRACVERWPGAEIDGDYDPRCCRFPKSCSASVYDEDRVTDEDLEPVEPAPELVAQAPALRRRGVVLVDEEQLARLLALPEAWRMLGFQPFPARMSIGVLVEGPDLPECPLGAEPPFVDPPGGSLATTAPPDPAAAVIEERFAARLRDAIAGATAACEHPEDMDGAVYPPRRACAECAAAAVLALLRGPDGLAVTYAGPRPTLAQA